MPRPSLGLQTPISWQEVGNTLLLCGIEPGLYRCEPVALTTMLPSLILRQFNIILIPINAATDLTRYIALPSRCARHFSLSDQALRLSQNNLHDTNHEQQPIFPSPLPTQFPPYSHTLLLPSDHHPK